MSSSGVVVSVAHGVRRGMWFVPIPCFTAYNCVVVLDSAVEEPRVLVRRTQESCCQPV